MPEQGEPAGSILNEYTTFLRGVVEVDASGVAVFDSIVPGRYEGRAFHVHYAVRSAAVRMDRSQLSKEVCSRIGAKEQSPACLEAAHALVKTHNESLCSTAVMGRQPPAWLKASACGIWQLALVAKVVGGSQCAQVSC